MKGDEVVQVYVRDVYASLVRPIKELKAFKRVTLQPKQSARVTFAIPVDMLNFTNRDNERIVEAVDACKWRPQYRDVLDEFWDTALARLEELARR
jgi:hypothetical protein